MASRLFQCALLSLLAPLVCAAQRYTPLPPPLTVDPCAVQPNPKFPVTPDPKAKPPVCPPPAPVGATPDKTSGGGRPSTAEQFPFPGGAPAAKPDAPAPAVNTAKPSTADQFPFPGSAPASAPATSPGPAAKGSSAGDTFPYPGETSKSPDAVPEGDTPRYVPDAPAAGGKAAPASSSAADDSSSSSSSSTSGDASPAAADDTRPAAPADDSDARAAPKGRRSLPKISAQSADERVTEDLSVAKFYSDHGNFEAAYLRSKDATRMMPNDAESHFSLAQAAQRLRKKDEAVAEYTLYLKLDPAGDRTTAAQRALSELQ